MSRVKLLDRRSIYKGKVVDLALERARLPGGGETDLEVIRHPGASAVVPLTDAGEVVLVRQYRHATDGWLLEVPAGKKDPGETPERCAVREVAEETGFVAGKLRSLGWIWSTPGFADEKIWLFMATDVRHGETGQNLDDDEVLSVVHMDFDEAVAMAVSGEITDAKTVCALLRAATVHHRQQ